MDTVDRATRSRIMAAVKSKGNRSTERKLRMRLAQRGIGGWRLHAADLPGTPDFTFDREKVAVFVDGCFWHGCPRCCRMPQANADYWMTKIEGNKRRDRSVDRKLKQMGWKVARLWEHQIRNDPAKALARIVRLCERRPKHNTDGGR